MSQPKLNKIKNNNPTLLSSWGLPSCGHLKTLSFRAASEDTPDPVELGLKSDRLFFEPERSSLLVEENNNIDEHVKPPAHESEMVLMDSSNPKEDFKKSMEEMVNAYGLMKDWDGLEELLGCYLRINEKSNHMYILSAFVDLLVGLPLLTNSSTASTSNSIAFSSPSSSPFSLPSSSLSSILDHHHGDHHANTNHNDNEDDDDDHISSS